MAHIRFRRALSGALWVCPDCSEVKTGLDIQMGRLREGEPAVRFRPEVHAFEVPLARVEEFQQRFSHLMGTLPPWDRLGAARVAERAPLMYIATQGEEEERILAVGLRTHTGSTQILLGGTLERERRLLQALAKLFERAPFPFVTYGGDLGALQSLAVAYQRHELVFPVSWEYHLDLIQSAYCLLRSGAVPDCRLSTVAAYYGVARDTVLTPLDLPELAARFAAGEPGTSTDIAHLIRAEMAVIAAITERLIRGEPSPLPDVATAMEARRHAERYLRLQQSLDAIAAEMNAELERLQRAARPGETIVTDYGVLQLEPAPAAAVPAAS